MGLGDLNCLIEGQIFTDIYQFVPDLARICPKVNSFSCHFSGHCIVITVFHADTKTCEE